MIAKVGAVLLFAALLAATLLVADSPSVQKPGAADVHDGEQLALPDPSGREIRRGVNQGMIPLGRSRIYVPILMYHYIQELPKSYDQLTFNLTVTPENFTRQLQYLWAHGYHPVTFDDLRAYFQGQTPLPSKPVVITFDDGYRDLYTTAYPILLKFGFRAVAYIVSGFVGRLRYVTQAMLVEMSQNGIEIADHTVDHYNLAHMLVPEITFEIVASRNWLEQIIGQPILDFAYPSGKFNLTDMQVLHDQGYSTATTEQEGTSRDWAGRYSWPRTRVGGGETLAQFIKNLGPVEPFVIAAPTVA